MILNDERIFWDSHDLPCGLDDAQDLGIDKTIKDVFALAPGSNDLFLAQDHQLLGDIGLPQPQQGLEMADTSLAAPNSEQDLHAHGISDGGQQVTDFFVGWD